MTDVFGRVPAEEAYRATLAHGAAKWPARGSARMEPVCLPAIRPGFAIPPGATVLTMGSCFARHIEFALMERGITIPTLGFRVPADELMAGTGLPTGILNKYTPFAMLNEVEAAARAGEDASRFLVDAGDGLWWDGQLHSHVPVARERGLRRRARLARAYAEAIAASAVVIVTLGLVEAWWDEAEGLYLNDTVPRPVIDRHPGRFFFETLSVERTVAAVTRLVEALHALNPAASLLLTVSPVPFARSFTGQDAVTANAYSKAALRVAAEVAARTYAHVDYYPSYESVTHTDRALAWEDDLIHVRPDLVAANVNRMLDAYAPAARHAAA